MITLNNSNIDFDIDSSNAILLLTSNLIFRTKTFNRMTIMDDGNVGIGIETPSEPLEIAGNMKASGLIISTGEGFDGKGSYLRDIPINSVINLETRLLELSGSNTDVVLNIEDTSNIVINRILEEIVYGSNYIFKINNELNTRVDNTSNYVVYTSNFLVNRIVMETNRNSNYVLTTSNIIVKRIVEEVGFGSNYLSRMDTNVSNLVLTTSNILVNRIVTDSGNNSNYILTTSNILVNRIVDEVGFGSNYLSRLDTRASNYVLITSNILVNRIVDEVGFGSNYLSRLDTRASNYVLITSNILVKRIVEEVGFGSNYLNRLDARASNYVLITSNILVNRIVDEVGFGSNYLSRLDTRASNYVLITSNILVNRIVDEVGFGSNYLSRLDARASNYVLITSNILVNRIVDEVGFGSNYLSRLDGRASNYVLITSNILVNRIIDEVGFGSNYLNRLDTRGSNYVLTTSNILVNRILHEIEFGANYAKDTVGVWGSNYTDLVGKWGSNYVDKLNAIAIVSSQWTTKSSTILNNEGSTGIGTIGSVITTGTTGLIFYNGGNVGIGTSDPLNNLHIYSSNNENNASSKIIIQELNTSNVYSSNISDIVSNPYVEPMLIEGTIDKYMIFTYTGDNTGSGQTQYTITLPENYSYDILMVGGGGGGGGDIGAGGGGGAVLYGSNIIIPSGTYNIKIGNGGNGTGKNGYNTEGFNAICLGGGGAKNIETKVTTSVPISWTIVENSGNNGGSGAGGKSTKTQAVYAYEGPGLGGEVLPSIKGDLLATSIIFGNRGGNGIYATGAYQSAGGGGAGSAGNNGSILPATVPAGDGGSGVQINITGSPYFWGAGGGGAGNGSIRAGNGGKGGGGAGTRGGSGGSDGIVGLNAINTAFLMNAAASSGSGGGGGSATYQSNGGNGGSGIIIIRYRPAISISGKPELQLVIGDRIASGSNNFKIGNYNGNFQIKTSTSNIDRTLFTIQGSANIGIGTNACASKLHLYDNNSNAILTLQDNTSVPTLIRPIDISSSVVSPATSSITQLEYGEYDKIIVFAYSSDSIKLIGQTQYNFTTSEDISVDILVVGGGGGGGSFGGGGGCGQILLNMGYNILKGKSVIIKVGKGGIGATSEINGQNGFDSSISIAEKTFIAKGGGGGGSRSNAKTVAGNNGGSGGGSSSGDSAPASLGGISEKLIYPNWKSFGNNGGIGSYKPTSGSANNHYAGGGGGADNIGGTGIYSASANVSSIAIAGKGGDGINLSSIFGSTAGIGILGLFGGGGGGIAFGYRNGVIGTGGIGGSGGGGSGEPFIDATYTKTGLENTGGGGGGGTTTGGNGGTGVVILRYRQKNREGNSEIQFIKGEVANSGTTNYKIGNYNGDYKIKSSFYNSDTDRFIIQSNGDTQFNNTSGITVATIFNNGNMRTAGSQITDSDDRIKKDIVDIDDESALRMILEVEPKTYKYIDDDKGSSRIYGFIAQQIKNIIPDATELRKNFLPNIMKRAICDNNKVYLDLTDYIDLPLNTNDRKINIRFKNGGGYNYNILEVNNEYFIIDNTEKLIEEVFVYGYEVNDFHILTKDYIYTLNVSATHELNRKLETQEERIKELEMKLEKVQRLINM